MLKRLLIAALFCVPAMAQVPVTPIVQPHVTFVDAAGLPCAGCRLFSYAAGSTTPLATFVDSTGTSQNPNPIVLDASGGPQTPSGSTGAIWTKNQSYKFILKSALGVTIWTVDNVNAGSLFPCGTTNAVQIANTGSTGLTCDANITVNPINHTLNIGTLGANFVTIGALGTPTTWTLDTTSPATARASLGVGTTNPGTINQLGYYAAAGSTISGTSVIPPGITGTTQAPDDSSTNLATTRYVQVPGFIHPTAVQIASGVSLSDNQGDGPKVQHSTGSTTSGHCVSFDATGNTVDSGNSCSGGAVSRVCNNLGSFPWTCYRVDADGTITAWGGSVPSATGANNTIVGVNFPIPFTDATSISVQVNADNCPGGGTSCTGNWIITATPILSTITTFSFSTYLSSGTPVGGGGGAINTTTHILWSAKGY